MNEDTTSKLGLPAIFTVLESLVATPRFETWVNLGLNVGETQRL
jgi:hypothetical protein